MMIRLWRLTNDGQTRCALSGLFKGVVMSAVCQHFRIFPLHPSPEVKALYLLQRSHSNLCELLAKRVIYTFHFNFLCGFYYISSSSEECCAMVSKLKLIY